MANSFFEKLKKGMGIEGPVGESTEEPIEEARELINKKVEKKTKRVKTEGPKKLEIKAEIAEPELKETKLTDEEKEEKEKAKLILEGVGEKTREIWAEKAKEKEKEKEKWFETEGELAIDVYQTENDLVIQSAIAGVKPESLDISIENDVIIIKGNREKPEGGGAYFTQECYWGPFSRKVILPVEIDPNRIKATMKEGILTIRIPKILRERKRKIIVGS